LAAFAVGELVQLNRSCSYLLESCDSMLLKYIAGYAVIKPATLERYTIYILYENMGN
jgi:hypothetical protein